MKEKMDLEMWRQRLRQEGFRKVSVTNDEPHTVYGVHEHTRRTTLVVLEGQITIIMGSYERILGPGERMDIKSNEKHAAKVGENGCVYLVAET